MTVFIGFLDKKIQFTSGSGYRSKQAENIHKEQQLLIDSLIKHGCTYFHDGYDIYIMITEIASIGTLDQIIFDAGLKSQRTLDDSFFSETILGSFEFKMLLPKKRDGISQKNSQKYESLSQLLVSSRTLIEQAIAENSSGDALCHKA